MSLATQAALGLAAVLGLMTVVWLLSLVMDDASIIDLVWGPAFALLAWLYHATTPTPGTRGLLVAGLVSLWAGRLTWHLARRHQGEDPRYAAMRREGGPGWRWRSLVTVFWLQAGVAWVIAWPLLVAARWGGAPGPWDVAGVSVFATGLALEVVADAQLAGFKADPANRGRVLDTGLWRYSRHPNYFGESLLWWGLWLPAVAVGGWWTVFSPLIMTWLLLRVSGVPMLERHLESSRPGYAEYARRTPAFVPWFPREDT